MAAGVDQSLATCSLLLEQGVTAHRGADLPAAEILYRRVLEIIPSQPDATNLLGVVALQRGQIERAISLGERACSLDVENASYQLNLGNALRAARRFAEAAQKFSVAIRYRPDYAEAYNNLGLALSDQNHLAPAIAAFEHAVELQPAAAMSRNNLGSALRRAGRPDEAAEACRAAISADATFAPAYNNLASALLDLDDLDLAIQSLRESIRLDPHYADAFANLCLAQYRAGNFEEAIAAGRSAIGVWPDFAAAHWNLSHALLVTGDYTAGFAEYEWRVQCPAPISPPSAPPGIERWTGQPIGGKTILLQAEQGFGDTIQFIRYAKVLANRGAKVILQCPEPLRALFEKMSTISALASACDTVDFFCPLMSLPHRLGSIAAEVPYLTSDLCIDSTVSNRNPLQVGLAWAGGRNYVNDRRRSLPLAAFRQLSAVTDVRFHSVQIGPAAVEIDTVPELQLVDNSPSIKNFADTAALISPLDLVITVDTAVAHLAGAMGKPVWVLLPWVPDWRWMTNRTDSPWYPTMRLFRQSAKTTWPPVIDNVTAELRRFKRK